MIDTNLTLTITNTFHIEPDSCDLVAGWILTMMLKLGGHREFIDDRRMNNDDLIEFLGLEEYSDDYDREDKPTILKALEKLKKNIDLIQPKSTCTILEKNLQKLCHIIALKTVEIDILRFCIYLHYYDLLENGARLLNDLTTDKFEHVLSVLLGYPRSDIKEAFASKSALVKNSFLSIDRNSNSAMRSKVDIASSGFADKMMTCDDDIEEMIRDVVRRCDLTPLTLMDYPHLSSQLEILVPYLRHSIENKKLGTNILLYGRPGTGKTELVKAITQEIGMSLYEVSYADDDDDPIEGTKRLRAYRTAQSLFSQKPIILMFDEIEDVISVETDGLFGSKKRQSNKGWINRILESNAIPTIWITNSVRSMDDAVVRRFDMAIEVPIPPKSKRREIIEHYSQSLLSSKSIKTIAENENVAPANITRAAKVMEAIKDQTTDASKSFKMLIDNTLKAQGLDSINKTIEGDLPDSYDPSYVNTSMDLKKLLSGIESSNSARLCLYGVPGTGKSAFGKWIARELDKPFLLKKGSDLISMYVGGTEKNIANAFREAKDEGAVLVFDEVDSFLQDRRTAKASWEVTQVNEMLVQMENYEGIFIATTNLMSGLDQASLRRFDLKLEFGYLTGENAISLFEAEAKMMGINTIERSVRSAVKSLNQLAPGDFAAVRRQSRFAPIFTADDLFDRLRDEVAIKEEGGEKKMGFLK
ncbi:MAG: AAA family ATPase [Sulfuricurvum sp.]|nr:AAA family ATPase [Sulfuricurvum sp.]